MLPFYTFLPKFLSFIYSRTSHNKNHFTINLCCVISRQSNHCNFSYNFGQAINPNIFMRNYTFFLYIHLKLQHFCTFANFKLSVCLCSLTAVWYVQLVNCSTNGNYLSLRLRVKDNLFFIPFWQFLFTHLYRMYS